LVEPLVYIQERGILVDRAGLLIESQVTGEKISSLTSELHACCGFELNPQSPKQLKEYFYETKNFRPYVDRKTGEITTNRDALKRLARKGSREAVLLLELRKHSKLKSTYLDMNIDPDNRLRCAFNPVGASSLRLSSSQTIFGTGGNMQNLPPAFKRFMLFDEGYIGYNIDLSQAENRCVAYIAPDPMMIRAFEENLDIHSLTGALISGLTYDEVKRQDAEGIYCPIGGGLYTWRFWGKKANHGLNYDLGYKTFAFYYEIPENESKFIVESYHRAYPGVRQYHTWIRARLSRDRTLESPFGSRRLFLDRWGDELYKEAYSWIPQHTIARKLNKQGLCPAYYDERFEPIDLLNQVHDSLVFQIPIPTPLEEHARMLIDLRKSLETPLEWRGSSFVIPMDLEATLGGGNMGKYSVENPTGLKKLRGHSIPEITEELRQLTCAN
jgi:DNA polymerase-1